MIDWDRVNCLKREVGADDFEEIADIFLEEVDAAIAGLTTCENGQPLAEALHFVKGSALNLGFDRLGRLCQDGERRATAGEPVDIAAVADMFIASRAEFSRAHRAAGGNAA